MHWQRRRAAARGGSGEGDGSKGDGGSLSVSLEAVHLSASFHGKRANPEIPRGDSPVTNEETLLRNRYL